MAPLLRNLAAALLALTAAGCATAPNGPGVDQNDPYEVQNRKIFELNQSLDRNFMLPVAKGYVAVVPGTSP